LAIKTNGVSIRGNKKLSPFNAFYKMHYNADHPCFKYSKWYIFKIFLCFSPTVSFYC